MRAALAAAALAATCALAAPACGPPLALSTTVISTTAPYFSSWNIDSSRNRAFFDVDFASPRLVYLASALSAGNIRFGGSGNDELYYDVPGAAPRGCSPGGVECLNATWIAALWGLAANSSNGLVLGLNIHPAGTVSPPHGPWDPANARALLQYLRASGLPVYGVELGNEQNTIMTAQQQAGAARVLAALLDSVYGAGSADRPRLIGPDPHSFRDAGSSMAQQLAYVKAFITTLNASGTALHAVTHHEYIEIDFQNVTNPSFLDKSASIAKSMVAAVRSVSASVEVWAGEVGPHNGNDKGRPLPDCAGNRVCGRWGSTLWYADSMSAKAKAGYAAYCRQDFIGAGEWGSARRAPSCCFPCYNLPHPELPPSLSPTPSDYGLVNYTSYTPSTDYFLLLLWKRLIGRRVLSVAPPQAATTRAYAFCAAPGAAAAPAAVLVLVNLDSQPVCYAAPPAAAPGAVLTQYILTPTGSAGVEAAVAALNGVPLALDAGGRLPQLPGQGVPASQGITLPPLAVALVVVPLADAQACA